MTTSIQLQTQLQRIVDSNVAAGSLPAKVDVIASSSDIMFSATQVVGTTEESLAVGDITDAAMCILINDDATNFVEVGSGAFTAFFKIPPGQRAFIPIVSVLANVKVRANTAPVNLTVMLFKIV